MVDPAADSVAGLAAGSAADPVAGRAALCIVAVLPRVPAEVRADTPPALPEMVSVESHSAKRYMHQSYKRVAANFSTPGNSITSSVTKESYQVYYTQICNLEISAWNRSCATTTPAASVDN